MVKVKYPIAEIEGEAFQAFLDSNLYAKEAVNATLYRFTDRFYIHQQTDANNSNLLRLIFESKDKTKIDETIPKQFFNELIDQQLRYDTEKQFGHIRNLIVEEAFKPVNK